MGLKDSPAIKTADESEMASKRHVTLLRFAFRKKKKTGPSHEWGPAQAGREPDGHHWMPTGR